MKLTPREREVITLVAKGYIDKEISVKLKISARTVQSHIKFAMAKLQARNRSNAVAILLSKKFIRKN